MVAPQILVLLVGVRILLGELKLTRFRISFFFYIWRLVPNIWSLRLSARTKDSQSLKKGSTPLGTVKKIDLVPIFFCVHGKRAVHAAAVCLFLAVFSILNYNKS